MFPSIFIISALVIFSTTTAIPSPPLTDCASSGTGASANTDDTVGIVVPCVDPRIFLDTIEPDFTLSGISDADPAPWRISVFEYPSVNGYGTFITREVLPEPAFEPVFRLTKGILTITLPDTNLTAYFGPPLASDPPSLNGFYFGNVTVGAKFLGLISCDPNDHYYLQVAASERRCRHWPLSWVNRRN